MHRGDRADRRRVRELAPQFVSLRRLARHPDEPLHPQSVEHPEVFHRRAHVQQPSSELDVSAARHVVARAPLPPEPYHVTQIAMLIVTFLMLVAFFLPMAGEWPSIFAATLFCIHTANTETMNLICARSELISTIGLLGSFLLYQRSDFARRTLLYLVPLAIGALAKAPLVVFAPLLFFYAMYVEHQPWRRAARIALPSLALGVALLVFLNKMNAPEWVGGGGPPLQYAITQPFAWLHYFKLFFLPVGLTADTDWTTFAHWYDTRAIAGDAFVVLLCVAIRPARPIVAFGLTWFAVALIPTSSFFPLAEVVNEHRIFFAFIGLVLAAAVLIPQRYRSEERRVGKE